MVSDPEEARSSEIMGKKPPDHDRQRLHGQSLPFAWSGIPLLHPSLQPSHVSIDLLLNQIKILPHACVTIGGPDLPLVPFPIDHVENGLQFHLLLTLLHPNRHRAPHRPRLPHGSGNVFLTIFDYIMFISYLVYIDSRDLILYHSPE